MSPPVALTKRWKKIKKRCSFSGSDRLVRSKSFTEQDLDRGDYEENGEEVEEQDASMGDKYLTVGGRDISGKFQGLKEKISQWNYDLKKRRSSDNLTIQSEKLGHKFERDLCIGATEHNCDEDKDMFVMASPKTHTATVKSAVVKSSNAEFCTPIMSKSFSKVSTKSNSRGQSPWSSPSPSPPANDQLEGRRTSLHIESSYHSQRNNDSYHSHGSLCQDQDSGYDGFCPEKSIYSTGSSDTSSVLSSEGSADISNSYRGDSSLEIYSRGRTSRPRPTPIYEKHEDYSDLLIKDSGSHYGTVVSSRAQIAQATVVNLVKSSTPKKSCGPMFIDEPPPLPPRPPAYRGKVEESTSTVPPIVPNSKPKGKVIKQGAISLPRKRSEFQENAKRRGSYHDNNKGDDTKLVIEDNEKVSEGSKFCTLPRQRKNQTYSIKNVVFEKGPGKKSLGFTVVGGKDSPKGSIGIYVKSIFPNGQAVGLLNEGDEIFSVNGSSVAGLTHSQAIGMFKEVKVGKIMVTLGRREQTGLKKQVVSLETDQC